MSVTGLSMSSTIATAVNAEAIPGLSAALDGDPTQGFTAALTNQLGLLNELNMQAELSQTPSALLATPLSTLLPTTPTEQQALANIGTAESSPVGQELAALIGENLPMSYKVNEDPSADPHLAVVTDAINYMAANSGKLPAASAITTSTDANVVSEDAVAQSLTQSFLAQAPLVKSTAANPSKQLADTKADQDASAKDDQSLAALALVMPTQVASLPTQTPEITKTDSTAFSTAKAASAMLGSNVKVASDKDAALKSTEVVNQVMGEENTSHVPLQFAVDGKLAAEDNKTTAGMVSATDVLTDGDIAPRASVDIAKLDKLMPSKEDVPAVTKPLNHPDWGKEMGERIVWMNNKSLPSAEIRINPQHLGPITVRIDVSQDQASVSFTAQHGVVRDALEASIPKLKEMMLAQNLDLTTVNVAQQHSSNPGQSQAQNFFQMDKQGQNDRANPMEELNTVTDELEEGHATVTKGLLSMYA